MFKQKLSLIAVSIAVMVGGCSSNSSVIDDIDDAERERFQNVALQNSMLNWEVDVATKRVERVCMEEKGFTTHPELPDEEIDPDVYVLREVLTKPNFEEREEFGYLEGSFSTYWDVQREEERDDADVSDFELLSEPERQEYRTEHDDSVDGSPEEIELSDGTSAQRSSGGCARDVEDILFEDYISYREASRIALGQSNEDWQGDERVVDVRADWAGCMDSAGHSVSENPLTSVREKAMESFEHFDAGKTEDEFHDLLLEYATDDAACHAEHDVQNVQEDVFWEFKLVNMIGHEQEVFAFQDTVDEIPADAQDIIDAGEFPPN